MSSLKVSYTHPPVVRDDLPHNLGCNGSMMNSQVQIIQTCKSLNLKGMNSPAYMMEYHVFIRIFRISQH